MKKPFKYSVVLTTLLIAEVVNAAPESVKKNVAVDMDYYTLIFEKGGVMIYPLLALSVITVLLAILYSFTINRKTTVLSKFVRKAEHCIKKEDYYELSEYCGESKNSVAKIFEQVTYFINTHNVSDAVGLKEVAEAESSHQAGRYIQKISYLSDIVAIAPMVGLLGTVIGMIKSFYQISLDKTGEGVNQARLAEGVSEALITTAAGLVIGIIAMIFYSVFRSKVKTIIAEIDAVTTYLLTLIGQNFKSGGVEVKQQDVEANKRELLDK